MKRLIFGLCGVIAILGTAYAQDAKPGTSPAPAVCEKVTTAQKAVDAATNFADLVNAMAAAGFQRNDPAQTADDFENNLKIAKETAVTALNKYAEILCSKR